MTENEAIEKLKCLRLFMEINDKESDSKFLDDDYEAIKKAIEALKTVQEMKKRNLTIEHIEEYMQFEDECIKKGFTFDSLLSARSKMEARKPVIEENKLFRTRYYRCPVCGGNLKINNFLLNYCKMCGQKIDWEVAKNE